MVGHAQNFHPVLFKMLLELDQRFAVLHLEGQMLHPFRRVQITAHLGLCRQFKERQDVAVPGIQKQMHVWVRFMR